jgi:hypothetical protein
MDNPHNEANLRELLADPLVRLVMARDGVTPVEIEELFANLSPRCGAEKGLVIRLSLAEAGTDHGDFAT